LKPVDEKSDTATGEGSVGSAPPARTVYRLSDQNVHLAEAVSLVTLKLGDTLFSGNVSEVPRHASFSAYRSALTKGRRDEPTRTIRNSWRFSRATAKETCATDALTWALGERERPYTIPPVEEVSEHEQTRQLFIEKFDQLAKHEDLIKAKDEIIEQIQKEANATRLQLQGEIAELQNNLTRFLPYKRLFKTSFCCAGFFLAALLSDLLFGVTIILKFWAFLGASISVGFVVMAYSMFLDWRKRTGQ